MKAVGRKTFWLANGAVNLAILAVVMLLLTFAGFALWDSEEIHRKADKSRYEAYKPTVDNGGKTFKELQALNSDVIAWLHVYGTNIDYPVTQGRNNMKYVNTNAEGQYSLSGAIFLDYHNSPDFSDFNSIIYGHHMEKKTMFGEIGEFRNKEMFDAHRYGDLFYDGRNHGIEFFAYIHADAYDDKVFSAGVSRDKEGYLDGLLDMAIFKRDIGVTASDRIVLLSTCSETTTNGRDILVGKLSGVTFDNPFTNSQTDDETKPAGGLGGFLKQIRLINVILLLALLAIVAVILYRQKYRKGA